MSSETTIETDPATLVWPGERQGHWTLRRMIREPARDVLALAGREATALVVGCGGRELAGDLSGLGFGRVEVAASPAGFGREPAAGPEGSVDLIVLEADAVGDEAAALAAARGLTRSACAILTRSRLESRDLAREAGFGTVSLIQPPADSERSFVLLERALIVARPAEVSSDG